MILRLWIQGLETAEQWVRAREDVILQVSFGLFGGFVSSIPLLLPLGKEDFVHSMLLLIPTFVSCLSEAR